jgi:hypothetical protein
VLDVLEARFGAKSMRMLTRTLRDDADPAAVEAHYRAALAGWTAVLPGQWPGPRSLDS